MNEIVAIKKGLRRWRSISLGLPLLNNAQAAGETTGFIRLGEQDVFSPIEVVKLIPPRQPVMYRSQQIKP